MGNSCCPPVENSGQQMSRRGKKKNRDPNRLMRDSFTDMPEISSENKGSLLLFDKIAIQ